MALFWQVTVSSSPEISDGLTNFLWEQGALGVVEEESPAEPPRVRAFFPEATSSTGLLRAVAAYRASLRSLGFAVGPAEPEVTPLLEGEWASAWQQAFPPREVGRRLLILPPWETGPPEGAGRVPVIIEPGRAFGTGQHGSTEGCLVLLEEALEAAGPGPPGARALDIGTGSGILAVAAVRLGMPAALAIDVDPDAVAAARQNAERNGCADRIAFSLQGPDALVDDERFPLVLANLLTHTHLGLARHYRRLVAPGGALVLGGLLAEEESRAAAGLGAMGFEPGRRVAVDGWSSLLFHAGRW
jgi:ribosomal protein L11 methyltransferase